MVLKTHFFLAVVLIGAIIGVAYFTSNAGVATTSGSSTATSSSRSSTSSKVTTTISSSSQYLTTTSSDSTTSTSTFISSSSVHSTINATTSLSTSKASEESFSSWLTYHGSPTKVGFASGFGSVFHGAARSWTSPTLDETMYAEPLVFNGSVFAATEGDSVYSLNDSSGKINWGTNLGSPIPLSMQPCGDITWTGITSTPVIDHGVLFASGFVMPGEHKLFAINVTNGKVLWSEGIDPPGMNVMYQLQRGALVSADGMIYIAFGGLAGDCGAYQGWVVGVPENDSGGLISYKVPTSVGGAIWGASGIAYDNVTNMLFVATGNSASNSSFDFGESVIALTPSLKEVQYFAPTNWVELNAYDVDLGSVGPTILNNDTIFQIGKQGIGYLLDLNHLGGIGGQLFSSNVCGDDSVFGGVSYSAPLLYVPCRTALVELKVNATTSTFTKLWNVSEQFAGAPIIAEGAVWSLDINAQMFYAYNVSNGAILFQTQVGYMGHFVTPSAGDGQIFIAANATIQAFTAF